ncbi:nucleotide exchange factor GrpE [Mycobacterium sp. 1274761.0]|uniref:nucleotide exchange factor GrpE n=1 Tax=Mycobacterium sp. 1274761.0 TaxID=1834077 RepID=UPI0007FEF4B6|nr:nucleotide exchange factor GrpE [Mycobacterium sp. 1274761.0]OBK76452.1 nucleotide exchange factor GrpE [Mycobacterium sp. 1274761.0]
MASPDEHLTTEDDRSGAANAAPEPVAPESDSTAELARLEDRWRRAVADLDNLRKRYARELERERNTERSRVAGAWLPIVDDLERALAYDGGQSNAVIEGVRTILDQAAKVLEQLGYPRDDETGVPFDPQRHEVVGVRDVPNTAPGIPPPPDGCVVRRQRRPEC